MDVFLLLLRKTYSKKSTSFVLLNGGGRVFVSLVTYLVQETKLLTPHSNKKKFSSTLYSRVLAVVLY